MREAPFALPTNQGGQIHLLFYQSKKTTESLIVRTQAGPHHDKVHRHMPDTLIDCCFGCGNAITARVMSVPPCTTLQCLPPAKVSGAMDNLPTPLSAFGVQCCTIPHSEVPNPACLAPRLHGLPVVESIVNIGRGETKAAAFRAINPLGKVPALQEKGPDGTSQLVVESGAILEASVSGIKGHTGLHIRVTGFYLRSCAAPLKPTLFNNLSS